METVLAEQGEDARSVIMMEPGVAGEPRELTPREQAGSGGGRPGHRSRLLVCCSLRWGPSVGLDQQRLQIRERGVTRGRKNRSAQGLWHQKIKCFTTKSVYLAHSNIHVNS